MRQSLSSFFLVSFVCLQAVTQFADSVRADSARAHSPNADVPGIRAARPPEAPRIPSLRELHGERFQDDYFWLRDRKNHRVLSYLRAENQYASTMTRSWRALQDTLTREMISRIEETDSSVPAWDNGYFYYSREEKGKAYPIFCRKKDQLSNPEEIYLDPNALAAGSKFFEVGDEAVSDDGNLYAYLTDRVGNQDYLLWIKDLRSGQILEQPAKRASSVAWAADNSTIFYVVTNDAKRPYRLFRHRLGEANDTLLYEEKDERYTLSVDRSRSRDFIFLDISSHITGEVRYLPAATPQGEWRIVAERNEGEAYSVDHQGSYFYIRSNEEGLNFGLYRAPTTNPVRRNWQTLIPAREDVMLEGIIPFEHFLVLLERSNGLPTIRAARTSDVEDEQWGSLCWREIPVSEDDYTLSAEENPDYHSHFFRYTYQSMVTPDSIYDYEMCSGEQELLKQMQVGGGYRKERYETKRVFAIAKDGTRIPISLLRLRELPNNVEAPLYLLGYGAYGESNEAEFSTKLLSLVDRGVTVGFAHVRGGGEFGKSWHYDGRMELKHNSFDDFIASAEYLIAQHYTSSDKLVASGASAGGLLVGAVLNMRPELFRGALLEVPFVDVINTMSDASLPLTVGEYEEWGNPAEEADYRRMKLYDPYRNLRPQRYPALLIKASLNDSRVGYWEPAKYVARLRAIKQDQNPLIFRTDMSAGHLGASGRYDRIREAAFNYAFVLSVLGKTKH